VEAPVGLSVLINVASLIAAGIAYALVAGRLPPAWSTLYVWQRYYIALQMFFFALAFAATVAAEFFICRHWEKDRNPWFLLAVVAVMNLITMAPSALESAVASRPRIPATFTLTPTAPWLQADGAVLYFFDLQTRTLNALPLGGRQPQVLTAALPAHGYRAGTDQRVCVLSVTNTAVFSWHSATGRCEIAVPLALTNILHVDCAPDGAWYATAAAGTLRIFSTADNSVTAAVDAADVAYLAAAAQPPAVCWAGANAAGVLTLDGTTNASSVPQPFWYWSPYLAPAATAVFSRGALAITVRNGEGIEIKTPAYTDTFIAVRGASYRGLGLTTDNRSFVFALGSEILALDLDTRMIGHVCQGAAAVLTAPEQRVPPESSPAAP